MTKAEKTLHKALLFDGLEESQVPFGELKEAMRQHAVDFAEWCAKHYMEFGTYEQAYNKFNNQEP